MTLFFILSSFFSNFLLGIFVCMWNRFFYRYIRISLYKHTIYPWKHFFNSTCYSIFTEYRFHHKIYMVFIFLNHFHFTSSECLQFHASALQGMKYLLEDFLRKLRMTCRSTYLKIYISFMDSILDKSTHGKNTLISLLALKVKYFPFLALYISIFLLPR